MKFPSSALITSLTKRFTMSCVAGALLALAFAFSATSNVAAQLYRDQGHSASSNYQTASHLKRYKRRARRARRARRRALRRQRANQYRTRKKKRRRARRRKKKSVVPSIGLAQKAKTIPGPVQIVVSLPEQRLAVYKGGQKLATAPISSGTRSHPTPTGVFSILQKNRRHFSNLYGGAPMPFMQRITWSGIALHAGRLPGYPASHGCIRLPHSFARSLFGTTKMNAHVVVTRQSYKSVVPKVIDHPRLFQPTTVESLTGSVKVRTPIVETKSTVLAKVGGPLAAAATVTGVDSKDIASAVTDASAAAKEKLEGPSDPMAALGDLEMQMDRMSDISAKSEKPLRIMITRRVGRESNTEVQRMLRQSGFDPGDVDGIIGKDSRTAIKAFQEHAKLEVTGTIDDELLDALYDATGRKKPSNGHLYIRQGYKRIFDVPVTIANPSKPLGTHLYTALAETSGGAMPWTALTTDNTRLGPRRLSRSGADAVSTELGASSAREALERIVMPEFARIFISDRLNVGSSMVIADNGHSNETGKYTDYIVKTR